MGWLSQASPSAFQFSRVPDSKLRLRGLPLAAVGTIDAVSPAAGFGEGGDAGTGALTCVRGSNGGGKSVLPRCWMRMLRNSILEGPLPEWSWKASLPAYFAALDWWSSRTLKSL